MYGRASVDLPVPYMDRVTALGAGQLYRMDTRMPTVLFNARGMTVPTNKPSEHNTREMTIPFVRRIDTPTHYQGTVKRILSNYTFLPSKLSQQASFGNQ